MSWAQIICLCLLSTHANQSPDFYRFRRDRCLCSFRPFCCQRQENRSGRRFRRRFRHGFRRRRDLVIGNHPMYWIANQEYVWATLALSFFAPIIVRLFQDKLHQTILVWLDAVGLGFFTAGGTSLSLTYDLPYLPAVLMGVCTGVLRFVARRFSQSSADGDVRPTALCIGCVCGSLALHRIARRRRFRIRCVDDSHVLHRGRTHAVLVQRMENRPL